MGSFVRATIPFFHPVPPPDPKPDAHAHAAHNTIQVVANGKQGYEMKYYSINEDGDDAADEE